MMRRNAVAERAVMTAAVSMMVAGMLAGCGSSQASAKSAGTSADGTTASSGVKVIKVGTGQSFAPYCYLDDNNNLTGYDVDVLHAIDDYLKDYSFDIQGLDFNTCIVSIDSGALDMVSYQLVQSDERKKKYIFPDMPYCLSPLSLVVKSDSGISSLEDLKGKTIYSTPTTYEYTLLTAYNKAHADSQFKIEAVSDMTTADEYKGISDGTVDAALTYQTAYDTTVPQLGIKNLKMTDAVLVEESYEMIRPDLTDFRNAMSEALKALKDNGTLKQLNEKWFKDDYFTKYANLVNYKLN